VGEKRGKEEKKSFPFSEFVRLRHKLKKYKILLLLLFKFIFEKTLQNAIGKFEHE
jgi:hypothetical protein